MEDALKYYFIKIKERFNEGVKYCVCKKHFYGENCAETFVPDFDEEILLFGIDFEQLGNDEQLPEAEIVQNCKMCNNKRKTNIFYFRMYEI